MDMIIKQQSNKPHSTDERESARTDASQADGDREAVATPSNTATNNSNHESLGVKFLRFGVDSLYLSYQGDLFPHIDTKLAHLKRIAQSDRQEQQAQAQLKIGDHLFEVKDKGSSMFSYVLEDNAFRIQLSRPSKSVPMAYVKISSEYLTHQLPADAEKHLYQILSQLGSVQSSAHVSRIDLFVDFVSFQNMEAWTREAWVTRAASVNAYAIDNRFTGWAIGMGGVIAARLYDKIFEICKSNKGYLIPLWEIAGRLEGDPVWRLEFEFKRDFLKQKGLVTLTEVLANLNGLWSYATTEWLKLTMPNPDDQTRARWPVHPLWQALSTVDWETSGGELQSRFSNARVPNKSAAMHRVLSGLTTWMAIEGISEYDLALDPFFEDFHFYIKHQAETLEHSIDSFIQEKVSIKARSFNTIDVNMDAYDDYVNEEVAAYRKASDGE
jgi:hypothetical protein